jgi:hypothetical protein
MRACHALRVKRSDRPNVFTRVPVILYRLVCCLLWTVLAANADGGLWTSAAELSRIPASGPGWQAVREAADQDISNPRLWDQEDNRNVYALAAGIVYARTGEVRFKNKVVEACERLIAQGRPKGRTLAWGRELGAYVLAADLVGYRTASWERWLRNMAEVYVAEEGRTLQQTFRQRPNNWGSHAFGTLAAIYSYLGDKAALSGLRDYWVRGVVGPNPGYRYGDDLSWHADPNDPRLINPAGATKHGMSIDGVIPDDLRRGDSFREPPAHTGYAWEFLQGVVMAARILERAGMPIWDVGDRAIYRAASALQVQFQERYGDWAAEGDDEWMLPLLDNAYGTDWSSARRHHQLWAYGKNTGWPFVADSSKASESHPSKVRRHLPGKD